MSIPLESFFESCLFILCLFHNLSNFEKKEYCSLYYLKLCTDKLAIKVVIHITENVIFEKELSLQATCKSKSNGKNCCEILQQKNY